MGRATGGAVCATPLAFERQSDPKCAHTVSPGTAVLRFANVRLCSGHSRSALRASIQARTSSRDQPTRFGPSLIRRGNVWAFSMRQMCMSLYGTRCRRSGDRIIRSSANFMETPMLFVVSQRWSARGVLLKLLLWQHRQLPSRDTPKLNDKNRAPSSFLGDLRTRSYTVLFRFHCRATA